MPIPTEQRLPVLREYWKELHDAFAPGLMVVVLHPGCYPDWLHINSWRNANEYNFDPETASDDDWVQYAFRIRDAYKNYIKTPMGECSDAQQN